MSELQKKWKELYGKMTERGDKLRQAGQQEQLMELLQVRRWWDAGGRGGLETWFHCWYGVILKKKSRIPSR